MAMVTLEDSTRRLRQCLGQGVGQLDAPTSGILQNPSLRTFVPLSPVVLTHCPAAPSPTQTFLCGK